MSEPDNNRRDFLSGFVDGYEFSKNLQQGAEPTGERRFGLKLKAHEREPTESPVPYRPKAGSEAAPPGLSLGWGNLEDSAEMRDRERLPKVKTAKIIPRSEWAQYPPDYTQMKRQTQRYKGVVLHHTGNAGRPTEVEDLHRDYLPAVESALRYVGSAVGLAQRYHMADVGYHFMIDDDGTIYEGRDPSYIGAHVLHHNIGNIGIAFLGDYSEKPLSKAAAAAGLELLEAIRDRYGLGSEAGYYLRMHGSFDDTKKDELKGAEQQIWEIRRRLKENATQSP